MASDAAAASGTEQHGASRGRSVLSVLAAATLFGTTGTSQALGPSGTTPLGVGAARIVIGGAGLLAVLPRLGGSRRDALALWRTRWGLLAGVTTALYQVCFFGGVLRAGVAVGTLLTIGSGPVFTGLLSWLLLRERPRLSWVVATSVCVVGLVLLVGSQASSGSGDVLGYLLALASGLGYAFYTVASKRLMNDGHGSDEVMAAAFGLGGLLLLPVLLTQPMAWIATPSGLAMALWLGLITTTLAYVLFGRGLRHLPAGPVTTLVLAEPVVATLLGVLVLGETIPALGWAGIALVLAGLGLQGAASRLGDGQSLP
ncbi:MAG: DMT family transporter [Actinobacteria bacterium]|nr:DMT family transporter [Actinomycetota bacterium]